MRDVERSVSADRRRTSLENVIAEFDAATRHVHLSDDDINFIREPRFALKLKLPVRLDDSRIKVFKAYHVIHSIMRGPGIGGLQFRADVNPESVEAFAFWSTHRCAVLGVPLGGSSGAIECDPAMLSAGEVERVTRRYAAELIQIIGPDNDLITTDIGTNQQIMCWLMDTYSMHHRGYTPAVALGKPGDLGGALIGVDATALGAELCILKACRRADVAVNGARVAIQGFGKAGMDLARLLDARGIRIVAIADISGAYVNENGITVREAIWHQESYGILDGLEAETDVARLADPASLWELPVDVLVPAAVELQITEANMASIRAKVIAEIAHDPVSPEADRYLNERGVVIVPDVLAGSGGIAGAYLEWVQNRLGYYWPPDHMRREIECIVDRAFDDVQRLADADGISLRLAAAVLAVRRVMRAAQLRGMYA